MAIVGGKFLLDQPIEFEGDGVSIGDENTTVGTGTSHYVVIGAGAKIGDASTGSIALGAGSTIGNTSPNNYLMGTGSSIGDSNSGMTVIGNDNVISAGPAKNSVAIGAEIGLTEFSEGVAIGEFITGSPSLANVLIGRTLFAGPSSSSCVVIGDISHIGVGSDVAVTIGRESLIGDSSLATVVIGYKCVVNNSSPESVAIGRETLIGTNCSASVALGYKCVISNTSPNSVLIGNNSAIGTTLQSCIGIGTSLDIESIYSIAIGFASQVIAGMDNSIAINGNLNNANAANTKASIAINGAVGTPAGFPLLVTASVGGNVAIGSVIFGDTSVGCTAVNGFIGDGSTNCSSYFGNVGANCHSTIAIGGFTVDNLVESVAVLGQATITHEMIFGIVPTLADPNHGVSNFHAPSTLLDAGNNSVDLFKFLDASVSNPGETALWLLHLNGSGVLKTTQVFAQASPLPVGSLMLYLAP